MPRITFYGAAGEVTGSCFLVEGKNITLLVDCGLFQGNRFAGEKNRKKLPFPCGQLDYVLVTHAHIDHTGRIPEICWSGFTGKILATKPTLDLTEYLWADMLEIMEIEYQETGKLPLCSPQQVRSAKKFFTGVNYGARIRLSKNDYAVFHDAGHILGSAFIELMIDGKRLVFSGDVGNVKPPIIRETEHLPPDIDLLVCESTYGGRLHESADQREKSLFAMIDETLRRKGVLVIPAFAVERTQELLYIFNKFIEGGAVPPVNIYLDSPLAIKATRVFEKYPEFYDDESRLLEKSGDRLFDFPGLVLTKTRKDSQKINSAPSPKIIIAGSGMMNGGRIQFHLERYLPDPANTLFIVGYQAEGTLGRKILNREKKVRIMNKQIAVRAHVHAIGGYSAHADQKKLLSWMKSSEKLKRVALVHGDREALATLSGAIQKELTIPAAAAEYGQTLEV